MSAWDALADLPLRAGRATFGRAVVCTPAGGAPQAITAIAFDANALAVEIEGGAPIESVGPALDVRLADLAVAPSVGDAVTISSGPGAGTYEIRRVEADGCGAATLRLVRVTVFEESGP